MLLAKNIRGTLYDAFDFPIITYDCRGNDASDRGDRYEGKYRHGNFFRKKENHDYLWRDGRGRHGSYMENRRFDVRYQQYVRNGEQHYFRGHGMSSRSFRDRDSNISGHQRRTYAPYHRQRLVDSRY